MQRMKLHLSGVKVPPLGSIQDRVIRQYMLKQTELEAKKMELTMLIALTNLHSTDPNASRDWQRAIKGIWSKYVSLLLGIDIPEQTQQEVEMMEYYQSTVKNAKLRIKRDKNGKRVVEGIDQLFPGFKK